VPDISNVTAAGCRPCRARRRKRIGDDPSNDILGGQRRRRL